MAKIRLNDDAELVADIKKRLKENDNFYLYDDLVDYEELLLIVAEHKIKYIFLDYALCMLIYKDESKNTRNTTQGNLHRLHGSSPINFGMYGRTGQHGRRARKKRVDESHSAGDTQRGSSCTRERKER